MAELGEKHRQLKRILIFERILQKIQRKIYLTTCFGEKFALNAWVMSSDFGLRVKSGFVTGKYFIFPSVTVFFLFRLK